MRKSTLLGGVALGVTLALGLGAAAQAQDLTVAWKGAPEFTNDDVKFKVRGRVYMDYVFQDIDGEYDPVTNTGGTGDYESRNSRIRTARLGVEGQWNSSWAYKAEVMDAIPYNAAILYGQGVNVCINSDDAEMGRRLNQEAAKTIKYGGVPAEEAWKMVTLNPAKALHLDHRMGSVEAGKDADLVLWNNNPLGIGAAAQMTFVDGVRYYDRRREMDRAPQVEAERSRLTATMLAAKRAGAAVRKAQRQAPEQWHCETLGEQP